MNFFHPSLRVFRCLLLLVAIVGVGAVCCNAQSGVYERTFSHSKTEVERALKNLQTPLAGRLPALDGFALPGDHPLEGYQRGYYQSTVRVVVTATGGCVVSVKTKVTAWYSDPVPAKSGYQSLTSNGRLETDFLDQLSEQLAGSVQTSSARSTAAAVTPSEALDPAVSAPTPRFPETRETLSSSLSQSMAAKDAGSQPTKQTLVDENPNGLQAEAASLEEVLKSQAHPKNLVAVKKSGTPVVATPSLNAKTLFMASAHDEFEMLDFNADWVHVRVSGLSRGWIWRNSLEMPDSVPDIDTPAGVAPAPSAAELFRVVREETAPFPGDWAPLRGKTVKIISVQKTDEAEKGAGGQMKLEFAKALFDQNYMALIEKTPETKPQEIEGIVLIFDSVDGGMIAAARPVLQQWKAGSLSDAALWHGCFFDPPETFDSTGGSASQ